MTYLERLKTKWQLTSIRQVIIILIVFGLTGTTVLLLKRPIVAYFSPDGTQNLWFSVAYYILILPIYNLILLGYGYLFGQFQFFWEFEKKSFNRLRRKRGKGVGITGQRLAAERSACPERECSEHRLR